MKGGGGCVRRTIGCRVGFDDLGVAHALVGGYAVFLHGLRRFTEDIDLLVTQKGLNAVREELLGRGYATVAGNGMSIRDAESRVRIDFVVAGAFPGDGKVKPVAFPDPDTAVEEHEGLRVIDLRTLIELKLASGMTAPGRLQDLADVQRLISIHNIEESFAGTLAPYVREKFLELCLTVVEFDGRN